MDGILVVDKPKDYTSFDVVAVVRKLSGEKKVGHTGTLDPLATGVLPVMIGKATRCAPFIDDTDKEYDATFKMGYSTDTQDVTGKIVSNTDQKVTAEQIRNILPQFTGDIMQLPPMYSAVQVNGKRLYALARKGIEIEREKRPVTVHQLELVEFDEAKQEGRLKIMCSKGTYVRTLISDIGQALGSLAVMTALRRTVACGFSLNMAVTLDTLREAVESGKGIEGYLMPLEAVFSGMPRIEVSQMQAVRFSNGGALDLKRTKIPQSGRIDGMTYRVISPDDTFLGVGIISQKTDELKILRLFNGAN